MLKKILPRPAQIPGQALTRALGMLKSRPLPGRQGAALATAGLKAALRAARP